MNRLVSQLQDKFGDKIAKLLTKSGEVTIEIAKEELLEVATALRDEESLQFSQLVDVCGVDYLTYGQDEWATDEATSEGFGRGVEKLRRELPKREGSRFAVVYHLLSVVHNRRLRMRVYVKESAAFLPSVTGIWKSADWFERETFDLFGILFDGHDDLRRILTDYGFVGHPFRKDFPLIGNVELRYDAKTRRCVYEPVSIEPRVLVPRVIRDDYRYVGPDERKQTGKSDEAAG